MIQRPDITQLINDISAHAGRQFHDSPIGEAQRVRSAEDLLRRCLAVFEAAPFRPKMFYGVVHVSRCQDRTIRHITAYAECRATADRLAVERGGEVEALVGYHVVQEGQGVSWLLPVPEDLQVGATAQDLAAEDRSRRIRGLRGRMLRDGYSPEDLALLPEP